MYSVISSGDVHSSFLLIPSSLSHFRPAKKARSVKAVEVGFYLFIAV